MDIRGELVKDIILQYKDKEITIRFTDEPIIVHGKLCSGACVFEEDLIYVWRGKRKPHHVKETIIHELLHYIGRKYEVFPIKEEEDIVSALANGLVDLVDILFSY